MRIKELLKQKGTTAKELASQIGISEGALSKSLSGNPTLGTLQKIATALNVDITELFKTSDKIGGSSHLVCPHCGTRLHITLEDDSKDKGTAATDKDKETAATNKGKGTAATDSTENASEDWDSALKEGLANF